MSDALSDVQVPLIAALLLAACAAKVVQLLQARPAGVFGPAMLPLRLRKPAGVAMCAAEFVLGTGLLVTSGTIAPVEMHPAATVLRFGTVLLLLTATIALIELRSRKPEAGCGCFGELSTARVSWRTITRSSLLTTAAAGSARAPSMSLTAATLRRVVVDHPPAAVAGLAVLVAELVLIAALSPEVGKILARLGYRTPCEVRRVPVERSLAALRSSRAWRLHSHLLISDEPMDVWRERCWRYAVFPGWAGRRRTHVVFGVYLRGWRPRVLTAITDAATGQVLTPDGAEPVPAREPAGPPEPARV